MQTEDNERREKNLEEAKKIIIENDSSLPCPETVCLHIILSLLMVMLSCFVLGFFLNYFMFWS